MISFFAFAFILWCSLPVTSNIMLKPIERSYPVVQAGASVLKQADAILVLGCRHYEDASLPFADRWHRCSLLRNLQAIQIHRYHEKPIYVSGGILKYRKNSEASANEAFFLAMGISPTDIISVPSGTNTEEEAIALSPFLKGKTVALVTSASHQIRAKYYLNQQHISVIPVPVEFLSTTGTDWGWPSTLGLERSHRAFYEWAGLTYQYLSQLAE
ncbi:membrane protein [Lacimicrobium alkaliphilum]|uniref:Membrane protein n=2 Tax=Lacimicrobium alkaliphilum TaxID=1526571 RepID=A0ABQ1RMS8_9ALTE|nr:membrane protein [Lacimicrobium alkaliphilum]